MLLLDETCIMPESASVSMIMWKPATLRHRTFNLEDKDQDANLSNQTLVNIQIIVFIFITFNKKYCKLKKI